MFPKWDNLDNRCKSFVTKNFAVPLVFSVMGQLFFVGFFVVLSLTCGVTRHCLILNVQEYTSGIGKGESLAFDPKFCAKSNIFIFQKFLAKNKIVLFIK